jgi:hypothetical protein
MMMVMIVAVVVVHMPVYRGPKLLKQKAARLLTMVPPGLRLYKFYLNRP